MIKQIQFLILLFLFIASSIFASNNVGEIDVDFTNLDQYLTINSIESGGIVGEAPGQIVSKLINEIEIYSQESNVIFLLKTINNTSNWNLLMVDAPLDTTYMIGSEVVKIVKMLNGNPSDIIGNIENVTVNKSIEYLMDELLKSEIRIGTGAIEGKYETTNGEWKNVTLQYILALQAINNKESRLTLSFFSPEYIEMPKSKGGYFSSGGVYSSDKYINPFIITINGKLKKENYYWLWEDEFTEVDIEFSEDVPDFGFKKTSFWERNIIEPLKEKLAWVKHIADIFVEGNLFNVFSEEQEEQIEENKELVTVVEKIESVEQELGESVDINEFIITEEEFDEKIEELNNQNNKYSSSVSKNESSVIVIKKNMTDNELKVALIKLYKELVERKKELNNKNEEAQLANIENKKEEKEEKEEPEEEQKQIKIAHFCSNYSDSPKQNNVIINEIAWMGTDKSSASEWIELKNISNISINLKNYQLLDEKQQIKILFKDYILHPGDFYLLERGNDETLSLILADQIYTGTLSNKNEGLYLFDSSCILEDKAIANPEWEAGDSNNRKSMERKPDLTWQTYSGDSFGTPRAENSEEQQLEEQNNQIILPSSGGKINSSHQITYCLQDSLSNPSYTPVIINEIAWMGTSEDSNDEWIELRNLTDTEISLEGYQLLDKNNQIEIVFTSEDIISPNGYYLLERTDDTSVPSIIADKIYTGSLSNASETIRLFNNNCLLVDEVLANPEWEAGDSNNRKSMERKPDLTWQTYSGDSFGTPRAENSEEQQIEEEDDEEQNSEEQNPQITYCLQDSLSNPSYTPVIINEIAWMGTSEDSNDEWIELRNLTDTEISLEGYQLLDKNNQIEIVFTSEDIISPNGYYLLERTDDTSVPSIIADKIYTGSLSNTDETLRLFNSGCVLMDEIIANTEWEYGNDIDRKSMERKPDLTWQTYSGSSFGTPREENSVLSPITAEETYCTIQGYTYEETEEFNFCVFNVDNKCEANSFYNGTCGHTFARAIQLDHLIITEIQDYDRDQREYVVLFNQTGQSVSLENKYIVYYSLEGNSEVAWNNPNNIFPLNSVSLENNSYYQIDFTKDNRGDIKIVEDGNYFYPYIGTICLTSRDVRELTNAQVQDYLIDCVGWKWTTETRQNDFEETCIGRNNDQRFLAIKRKYDIENQMFFDRDNNHTDFIMSEPSVKTLPMVENFTFEELEDKTKIKLKWDYDSENVNYKIYYSEDSLIDVENLQEKSIENIVINAGHVEVLIEDIVEGVDYRFKVKIFDNESENTSELSNTLFYVYYSNFDNHLYASKFYDVNERNKTSFTVGQNYTDNLLINKKGIVAIDFDNNIYFLNYEKYDDNDSNPRKYYILHSYDENGNFRWKIITGIAGQVILKDSIYIISDEGYIKNYSYNGKELWSKRMGTVSSRSAKIYNNKLYFVTSSRKIYYIDVLNPNNDAVEVISFEGGIGKLRFVGDNLYFGAGNKLYFINLITKENGNREFLSNIYDIYLIDNDKLLVKDQNTNTLLDLNDINGTPLFENNEIRTEYIFDTNENIYLSESVYSIKIIDKTDYQTSTQSVKFLYRGLIDGDGQIWVKNDRKIKAYEILEDGSLNLILETQDYNLLYNDVIFLINNRIYLQCNEGVLLLQF